MQGAWTADVRLQEAHVGPGSSADAVAAWKATDGINDRGYQPLSASDPGSSISGMPLLPGDTPMHVLQQHVVELHFS